MSAKPSPSHQAAAEQGRLRLLHWWFALGAAMVTFVIAGSLFNVGTPVPVTGFDKVQHTLAYTAMTWWWGMVQPRRKYAWAIAMVVLGSALEWGQSLTPYRHMDWADAAYNVVGVAAGLLLLLTPARLIVPWFDRQISDRLYPSAP